MAASAWTTAPARTLDFLSDERLARLAARGDERAFGALFERYQPGLTRYCRTVLRHTADAEDATQNALLAAHRALQGGAVPMRVKPWLYKIAHNEAISLVRSRKPAEELDETVLPTVADAEEAGEVRRRLGQLMADLQALTERQREALVLRELCGMDYAEIATTLGSSVAAAQQTVFEARSALQQFGEGRALDCEGVQRAMSECDGMRLRTRTVRAHLRGCERCTSFEASLLARRRDLGLLFPPTGAAGGILAALGRILGGGGAEPLLAALGLKGAAIGLALLAGGGAVVATSIDGRSPAPSVVTATPASAPAGTLDAAAAAPAAAQADAPGSGVARGQGRRRRAGRADTPGTPRPTSAGATTTVPGSSSGGSAGAGTTHASTGGGDGGGGAGGGGGARETPALSTPSMPVETPPVADPVTGAVGETVSGVTEAAGDAVQGTVDGVTGAAGDVVDTVTGAADDAVTGLPNLP